jgi:hypothetical protein
MPLPPLPQLEELVIAPEGMAEMVGMVVEMQQRRDFPSQELSPVDSQAL